MYLYINNIVISILLGQSYNFLILLVSKIQSGIFHALYSKNNLVGQLLSIKLYFFNLHKIHLAWRTRASQLFELVLLDFFL